MESKEHTPAIVVTEIGDCISTWNEVLLGIEEEGIPFRIQHIRQVKSSMAHGRLLVSPPVGWHSLRPGKADCALQKLTGISATVYADVSTR